MVLIPAGSFTMGVPEAESMREKSNDRSARPLHTVTIARPFYMSKFGVTRAEYAAFVADLPSLPAGGFCDWRNPGFVQTDRDPVVCVSAEDADAYAVWLSAKTKQTYRLPSEAEWEYAARAGTVTARYWGDALWVKQANCDGCQSGRSLRGTAPSGSFSPNLFGLYDVLGNAGQWTSDCWHDSYAGAPSDGSVWRAGVCRQRVVRGGSWNSPPWIVRTCTLDGGGTNVRYSMNGFRLSRSLSGP